MRKAATLSRCAKAAAGSVTNEAYAVYADKGTVLFGSNAELNTSDGASTPDNNVLTSLNNATLGFSGTSADRKVTGGTLQLSGSNEFRVTTDLANNKSDRFTFAKLASGRQYGRTIHYCWLLTKLLTAAVLIVSAAVML